MEDRRGSIDDLKSLNLKLSRQGFPLRPKRIYTGLFSP
jgi:hypothetical protein